MGRWPTLELPGKGNLTIDLPEKRQRDGGVSSAPGPMASPGGWTVSAGNDHRPTEERRLPRRRYLGTGERPRREGARDRERSRPMAPLPPEGALRGRRALPRQMAARQV